jgi:MAGUK p55 subfamily protein 5
LVPSFEFEALRREMNKEYERELEKENEPVLCGKKKNKKAKKSKKNKKKNKKDHVEEEIIHPYEYVKLHQQPPDRRRPIVLIGPRNVGRYELRDKLTNDKYEEFCVPIAHTSRSKKDGETNGQDYMFVSKDQFEQHKKKGYFVEDGEYQKNLYGTSIESIQQVIERGKTAICVMLAPSIKIMREKMLKPYVIFIKPPNREQILANQRINGKQLDEEEIASMIDQARVIEQDYGHLFDDIIINHNTDDTYEDLRNIIKKLETTPQWVPVSWLDIKY